MMEIRYFKKYYAECLNSNWKIRSNRKANESIIFINNELLPLICGVNWLIYSEGPGKALVVGG
jgi:hypothetical protein